ncbi:type 4a pilus biogenesis protein PilO [Candidatus Saccharibacteria bacterium]|jgi:Tfp pilus assembly protein PilO|nr:type 4a pilus biogenesis protein PilO [Candidatus Saccharibacteria bacterium]
MKKTKDQQLSKREQVVKAGSTVLIVVAVSSVIVMFSVMSMRFLWQQKSYNSRVIKTKTEARDQLTTNLKNIDKLSQQFGELNSSETTNSKTILHALPPVYDYAALASSIDSLASLSGVSSDTNIGEDTSSSALNFATTSQPVEIPLNLNIKGSYDAIRTYIDNLERSIRPIQIQALTYTGTNSDLQILIEAKTYYQPARSLDVERIKLQ